MSGDQPDRADSDDPAMSARRADGIVSFGAAKHAGQPDFIAKANPRFRRIAPAVNRQASGLRLQASGFGESLRKV